jgi:hypothetical protein
MKQKERSNENKQTNKNIKAENDRKKRIEARINKLIDELKHK